MNTKTNKIEFDGMSYGVRELDQILRRKSIAKIHKSGKEYSRKNKHKNNEFI